MSNPLGNRAIAWIPVLALAGVLACPAAAEETGKRHKSAHATKHRQAARVAQPNSSFQGGVMKGPLYNGQDYLGDDPDPNIRAYLMRDKSRYGGFD